MDEQLQSQLSGTKTESVQYWWHDAGFLAMSCIIIITCLQNVLKTFVAS
jgi:hypothetical protein